MNESKRTRRGRWMPALGVIFGVGGCRLPSGLAARIPLELPDGLQTLQCFVQDFARQVIAAFVL